MAEEDVDTGDRLAEISQLEVGTCVIIVRIVGLHDKKTIVVIGDIRDGSITHTWKRKKYKTNRTRNHNHVISYGESSTAIRFLSHYFSLPVAFGLAPVRGDRRQNIGQTCVNQNVSTI